MTRARKQSDQVVQADARIEAAQRDLVATTQRILETARRVESAVPEEVLPEFDDTSTVRHIQELRDHLSQDGIDVTSSWKPMEIKTDTRGNVTLVAYDGTSLVVQRKDVTDLIEALTKERDLYVSGRLPVIPDGTKPE